MIVCRTISSSGTRIERCTKAHRCSIPKLRSTGFSGPRMRTMSRSVMSEEATLERRKTLPKTTDEPMRSSSDPEAFREVMRQLSYPVTVVTVELEESGQSHGATVSSFSSVALQPQPLVSLALRRPSRLAAHLVQRPRQPFSVFLLSHQSLSIDLASLFSRPKDRIPSAAFASLQQSCLARLDCQVLSSLDLAELHADNKQLPPATNQIGSTLFIGQVLQSTYSTLETPQSSPLMYHNRSYTTVKN
ncbi:hypothetical protein PGT21_008894 [Puccinia graminis f. sp. tritici]|uniref:Flavin reductase like domain-containing protein n=1 Tax=Puccinia graminis f. sp. tritici TaxID=56615 RepID=A0A5B0N062_PUCGR|nr:hypothetical protein PGT21_008894 [Puccinia graminis f. sp. tritici]KAA1133476.1 hypothetical protein PGTUg99_015953 [Puccinia graminis f. sp. tritici]